MKVFEVFADGKKIGITVASDHRTALLGSLSGASRKTDSKDGDECDYKRVEVKEMGSRIRLCQAGQPSRSWKPGLAWA